MNKKTIDYYMSLSYTVKYRHVTDDPNHPEGYFFGGFEELDGCQTDARTVEELLVKLEEVKRLWIETKLVSNDPIPEPETEATKGIRIIEESMRRNLGFDPGTMKPLTYQKPLMPNEPDENGRYWIDDREMTFAEYDAEQERKKEEVAKLILEELREMNADLGRINDKLGKGFDKIEKVSDQIGEGFGRIDSKIEWMVSEIKEHREKMFEEIEADIARKVRENREENE
ncbi:type II toxin-antitoxin system HicB family antitoxin [Paenibacillus rigui]|uniref:HicB family protein n=1 Tax=Paenibacillus rigui TaxID=554312 RepID=A0A229UGN0_9BACL|nr:type II toxin-antitoxin system HicB family antitoxin [Paenibacillus rigui]OXM82505.1 hypothetical protein CF651_30665 [Paenibacillus rigui]